MTLRFLAVPALLAGALSFVGATAVRADDDCQKRTVKADHNLHEAIKKHGPNSPEAEHYRSELAAARSFCWDHDHKWWDEDGRRWHSDKDWDIHDHDH